MTLDAKIEAILFFKAEPVKISKLASWLETSEDKIAEGLRDLESKLNDRGLALIRKDDEVVLGTQTETSDIIARITKEELSREIGKAGLETLTIILYRGPISRADIDYLRGVNSTFILRNLMVRGLVERVSNPSDARGYLYKPTFELLSLLGITRIEDLPDFSEIVQKTEDFQQSQKTEDEKIETTQ